MENFSLENHHMMKARQSFFWSMAFTKVSNPFLPSRPKWLTRPLDVCGVYLFSLRIFSQTSLQLEIFSPRYNGVRFCSALYVMSDIFFSAGYFFPRNLFACFFPKSFCRTFFLQSPIIPSKVKCSASKIHQTFGQLTDSICQSFLKAFETIGDNTL